MFFDESGPGNTEKTVELAVKAAKEKGIGHIVVASVSGDTANLLAESGLNVVCVTHVNGFKAPGVNQMEESVREKLRAKGVAVLTTTHVLSGVERGISQNKGGQYPAEIIAETLRMFGQGLKVCVEVAIMALDAGLIPYGQDIIAIGGTSRGADTALIVRPAHASQVFQTSVRQIICKPY